MKDFWSENKKIIGKLILNQFGATFFGLTLILAAYSASTVKFELGLIVSIFSIIFYVFLIYSIMWEKGGLDKIRVDGGRAKNQPMKGLYIALIANILNILLGILIVISEPFKESEMWAGTMNGICRAGCLLWESMYEGLLNFFSSNNPMWEGNAGAVSFFDSMRPYAHLIIVIPSLLVCEGAYLLGLKEKKLFGFIGGKKKKN